MYTLKHEDEKYSQLYKCGYNYGPVERTLIFFWPRYTKKLPAILDCGCGRALIADKVKYSSYVGVDISSYQIKKNKEERGNHNTHFIHGPITRINNLQIGHVDVAFSIDVLEHIPEEFADEAVEVMCKASETQIFSISCIPSFNLAEDGSNLHLNVKPPKWWVELIGQYTNIRETVHRQNSLTLFCGENYMRPEKYDLPKGVRMRSDGSFYLPRRDKTIEAAMDAQFVRMPNERYWLPDSGENLPYEEFTDCIKDQVVGLVGKGPSLDSLTKEHFDKCDLVITINQAIRVVENLELDCEIIACQIDAELIRKCFYKEGRMLVSLQAKHHYGDKDNKYIFNDQDYSPRGPSGRILAAICEKHGAKEIIMYGHDACVTGDTGYASGINTIQNRPGDRYRLHRQRIDEAAGDLPITWFMPTQTDPDSQEPCTPPLSPDSPKEHHEHVMHSSQLQASEQATLDQPLKTELPQHDTPPDHSDKSP